MPAAVAVALGGSCIRGCGRGCGRSSRWSAGRWRSWPASSTACAMYWSTGSPATMSRRCSPGRRRASWSVSASRCCGARAGSTSRRRGATAAGCRRALGVAVAAYFVVLPGRRSRSSSTTRPRRPWSARTWARPTSGSTLTTSDGLRLAGWYVPSRNRAAVIVFPGRRGPVAARADAGPPRLRRAACSTAAARARARATTTPAAGAASPTSRRRWHYPRAPPDVDRERIGGLGLSVGGELLLQTAARDGRFALSCPRAPARSRSTTRCRSRTSRRPLRWLSPMTVETAAGVVLANRRPPPGLIDSSRGSRRAPCC